MSKLTNFVFLLVLCVVTCEAKVINTESSSSYLTKLFAGVSQTCVWLKQLCKYNPDKVNVEKRRPKNVSLALVGFGRTGGTSLIAALKRLGYIVMDDDEMWGNADVLGDMTSGALTVDEATIELGMRGYDAALVRLYKYVEWAATAPNVKVIITVRDTKKWVQSALSIIPGFFLHRKMPFKLLPVMKDLGVYFDEVMINLPTQGHPELIQDIPTLEAGFEAWTKFVRDTVPEERLLIFDVKSGWKPLCDFLDKPIPNEAFPHINDRVVAGVISNVFIIITWIWPFLLLAPFLIIYCLVSFCRSPKKIDIVAEKQD